jgi:plastocyanin
MNIAKSLLTTLLLILPAGCALQAASITGKVTGGKGITVVYVDAVPGKTFPAPEKHFVMDQKAVLFQPHVLVLPVGATVDFQNSDSVAHNVFWPNVAGNKKDSHNLGTWPKGQVRNFKFDKPGAVPLLCNVHPEMSGFLIVTPTPYFAETDAGGNFKIADVPAGAYTLTTWHEGMKPQSKPVTVGADVTVDFSLGK